MNRVFFVACVSVLAIAVYYVLSPHHPVPLQEVKEVESWHLYTAPSERFTVLFPVLPQHVSDVVLDAVTKQDHFYETYLADDADGSAYVVTTVTYPEEIVEGDRQKVIDSYIERMKSSNPLNRELRRQAAFQGERLTVDFDMENDQVGMQNRAFIEGRTLYVLSRMGKKEHMVRVSKEGFVKFTDSFRLLNSVPNAKSTQESQ